MRERAPVPFLVQGPLYLGTGPLCMYVYVYTGWYVDLTCLHAQISGTDVKNLERNRILMC